jgi:hypothetical protein
MGGPDSPQAAEMLDSIRGDRDGRLTDSLAGDYRQKRGTIIMSSHPPGEVSNRRKAAAIRLLSAAVDDESAPLYLRVQSARTLLQQQKEAKPADPDESEPSGSPASTIIEIDGQEFVRIGNGPKVVILPYNRRKFIVEDRERARLERLAETQIDDDEPQSTEPQLTPRPPTGRERLRLMRERHRAIREAPFGA